MGDLDTASLFLSLPDGIFISSVHATTTELVVRIACQRSCAACPLCQQTSERVYWLLGSSVQKQARRDGKDLLRLLANAGGLVYNQQSSTACSCSNDDTLT